MSNISTIYLHLASRQSKSPIFQHSVILVVMVTTVTMRSQPIISNEVIPSKTNNIVTRQCMNVTLCIHIFSASNIKPHCKIFGT